MKMADNQAVIHSPQSGESLGVYLNSYTQAELIEIVTNSDLCIQFCEILQQSFNELQQIEDGLENLWKIIERLNNFHQLKIYIKQLMPVREDLLKALDEGEKEIQNISRLCTYGRLLGSTVDIAGTVGGLLLKESRASYANIAFRAATSFGLLSLVSSASEISISKQIFDKLIDKIKRDQQLVEPIKHWYQQCTELEEAMRNVFPFDGYEENIQSFFNTGQAEFTPVKLLSAFLLFLAEKDIDSLRNEKLIRNLILFTTHPDSQDWYEWFIFYRHPVMLDVAKIVLQLQTNPLSSSFYQFIPSLPVENQNLQSVTVWGRVGLNAWALYDAVKSLISSKFTPVAAAIQHLRKHLKSEKIALEQIVKFGEKRSISYNAK